MCATPTRHRVCAKSGDAPAEAGIWAARKLVDTNGPSKSARHARRRSTTGLHIGRVGALAISLGVGFAIASGSGVASADTESTTSSAANATNDGDAPGQTRFGAKPNGGREGADSDSPSSGHQDDATEADPSESEDDVSLGEGDGDGSAGEGEDVENGGSAPELPATDTAEDTPTQPSETVGSAGAPGAAVPAADAATGQVSESTSSVADAGDSDSSVIDVVSDPAGIAAETDVVPIDDAEGSGETAVSTDSPQSEATENVGVVDVLSAVVSSVLAPLNDPATPARAPWFDALLAWVRRQITHTFFNESPEWGPVTAQQLVTGQVVIDLNAVDPNGDPLTFKIVQPDHGVVLRDPLTGNFVYTPTSVVTGAPLIDSFTVVISDSSEHLKGLLGVIQGVFHFLRRASGLAEPDEVTLMIPVTVNPIVELPPVVAVTPVGAGITGDPITVSPIVVITDLDSDKLTSATVTLNDPGAGQVLEYGPLPSGVTATYSNGVLTFTGAATLAAYQDLLATVTLTAPTAAIKTVSFQVVDDQNKTSLPSIAVITVVGLPVEVPPLVIVAPVAAGVAGQPITISPIVVITDLDSDIESATVTITDPAQGDVLAWGAVPAGFEVSVGAGSVTFSGAATAQVYQQLLQSVTLSSTAPGLKAVSFSVTDVDGNPSVVPAGTVVTVIGLPIEVPPLVIVSPVATGVAGQPITVSPVVVITDLDSDIESATVTITDPAEGDVLSWGTVPAGFEVSVGAGSVTFSGAATAQVYQQLLQSVTLSSTAPGLKSVSFAVTDVDGNPSVVPAGTVVTVIGLPVEVPPLVIVSPVAAGAAGQPIRVSPIVVITDLDSDIESATVTITDPAEGDVLSWGTVPAGFEVSVGAGSVTFSGAGTAQVYQQLLQSVTLSSASAGLKSVSFSVTDVDGNPSVVPAGTVVTVVGLSVEVPPLVVVSPVAAGAAGQPITISPIVVITDLDSDIESATVTISDPAEGDVLAWGTVPAGFEVSVGAGSVTFSGAASAQVYQQLLQSVTLSSTAPGLKTVSFSVTDVDGNPSVVPAGTVVTVIGLPVQVPPLVVVSPVAAGAVGQPITVSPIVVITDLDSDIESATVTISDPAEGDVLAWGELPDGFEVTTGAGSVTFTGAASAAVYQQLLQSVTLSSTAPGLKSVSFAVNDVDGNPSVVPAGTVVTVVGLSVEVPPLVIVTPVATGAVGQPITVSPIVVITDLDSDIESATVTITDPAEGDVLAWGELPAGFQVSTGAGSVTFTGAASAAVYQQLLQSVTFTSTTPGLKSVSFAVTDVDGNPSVVPAGTVVTVVGLPVEVPPLVIVTPVATGFAGQPITISPIVVITDLDSDVGSATVTITDPAEGDVLAWGELPAGFQVSTGAGSVTFTGAASAAVYQQLLQSVTFTSTTPGLKSVSFAVTDVDGNPSVVPAGTVVTVVGLSVEVPPVVVVSPVAAGAVGQPITVSPIVVITDLDSDIESATVTITDPAEGDVLAWGTVPAGFQVSTGAGSVTFTGAASAAVYQQLLQSVTLSSTAPGLKTVSFSIVDVDGNPSVVPAGTVVTVIGLPVEVPPLVIVSPVASGVAGQPITISPIVVITDLDSDIESATVTITDPAEGDVLSWGTVPAGFEVSVGAGSVTFTGAATAQVYQQLLQSVTLSSTAPGLKSVSFAVTDVDGNPSVVPAGTVVTVVGLSVEVPPLVVVSPVATGVAGQPITISPIVIITDLDSDIESATVTIADPAEGDVLAWGELPDGFEVSVGAGSVTFSGAATAQVYQQLLQSVTLSSTAPALKSVSFSVIDVDGNPSVVPASTVVTVVGLPVEVPPLMVVSPVASGVAGQPITISPIVVITDLDSDIGSATVTITDPAEGDVLAWGELPDGFQVTTGAGSVTFTGAATAQVYQQLLQSVTFTSTAPGLKSVSFSIVDVDGNPSAVPAGTVVTVVGLPVEVPPLVIVSPVASGVAGQPITISPIVIIADLDSDIESATVTITDPAEGDVLAWGELPDGFEVTTGTGSVTFTGAATAQVYQQLLQSVTLSSTAPGLKSVSFAVTDVDGNPSVVPAGTVVTVVGLSVEVPPLVVVSPVATGVAGQPITISPIVIITDLDSDIESATVTIADPAEGDVLSWGELPDGFEVSTGAGTVTFTGAATAAIYQQLLQSVTLSSTDPGLKSVSFGVTDVDGNPSVVPAGTVVTVVGLSVEVPPVVVVSLVASGVVGQPITVSPIVVITDLDSDIESATVTITEPAEGDVLAWGELPDGFEVSTGAGTVTFTGAASAAVYQQLLQSVTLTSTAPGLKSVSFSVTDADGNPSVVPAATAVTVVGLSVEVPPLVVVSPVASGVAGQPITISPIVVITDLDSDIESATVTISDPAEGDVLAWGELPDGFEVSVGTGSVTFSGAASAQVYQQLLQSVTLTSANAGLKSVSFGVTDVDGNPSVVPAGTVVTVVGLSVEVPPVVVVSPVASGVVGEPITVSPIVVITDLDSDIESATVTITDPAEGDVLAWGELPDGFQVTTGAGSVTFSGAASAQVYQQLLQSVTLTSANAGLKSVSFAVTDVDGNPSVVPAATAVTVVGLSVEVPPLVVVSPMATGVAGQPITVSPIMVITDLDSDIESATVTITDPAEGDVLAWGELPDGFEVSVGTGSVTFSGAATAQVYQQLLQSVTLTSGNAGLKSVSFGVTDVDGNPSVVPAGTVVTVVGLSVEVPPVVVVSPVASGVAGQPITVSPIVVITDLDSDIESATVTITDPADGDMLSWGEVPDGFVVTTGAGSVTFTGAASAAIYQQLLQSVTLSSTALGLKSVGFSVTDVDGNPSVVPAATAVTVVGLSVEVPPLVVVSPVASGVAGQPITISPIVVITDLDSDIESATVAITDPAEGDVLSWGEVPDGFVVTTGAGSVTFTGAASAAVYQQLLQSVTLSSTAPGLKSVSFSIVDVDGNPSVVPAGTVVTVVGLSVEVPPLVVVSPVAAGAVGQPITVSPIVVITDLDSDIESATVTITDPAEGDVLAWGELPDGFEVSTGAGTVTFTGAASAQVYQQLLQSVTLTSANAGLKSVSFAVTDVDGNPSAVPAGTVVTVVGLSVEVPPVVVVSPVASGVAGQPITISPIVVITDLDSDIESATVTITDAAEGDVLAWGEVPDGFEVTTGAGSVTFTGAATAAIYQQLLQSVTLTSTAPGLKSVSFSVVDVDGNPSVVPAGTVVTVVGLSVEVPPVVVVSPVASGVVGQPITISPIVVITDLDSDIESATATITDPAEGDVLAWGEVPDGFEVSVGAGSVTFTGAASAQVYQQLLQSVTLTSANSGLKSVSFAVTDVDGNPSVVPAGSVVTVVGLSVEVPPLVVVSPVASGVAGQPITVSPIVVITDLDSDIESATVTIADPADGDVLAWGELPDGFVVSVGAGSVTFTGAASAQVYQQLLQSVTLTSANAGLKSVSFGVTDVDGNPSAVPAGTVVTVVGLSVEVPPVVVVSPVASGVAGQPITISPIVVITDLDSDIESATVTISDPADGDVLAWGAVPDGFEVTTGTGSVTFTGAATAQVYQQLLQSVTLSSTAPGLKSISFSVTDIDGNPSVVPAGTVVTVVGLSVEVPPLVVVSPVASGVAGQPITVSPIVVITDLDSDIESATVTITDPAEGDVLAWGELPDGFEVTTGAGSVTFTGAATAQVYQQLLQSVTLSSTAPGLKSISFSVTDIDGNPSVVPAATAVTVVGLSVEVPPVVVVSPVASGVAGQPITISPIVVITDLDSDIESATVTITDPAEGDVLAWATVPAGFQVTTGAGSVTFTGAASAQVYQELLQSVTLTSTAPGLKSVSFSVVDVDGNPNVVPAGTVVTVVGLSVEVPPLVVVSPVASGVAGQPITVSPIVVITDLDSDIESATVTISDPAEGDVLAWGTVPNEFEVTTGTGSVTFTGAASAQVYQQLLQSVTLSSTAPGLKSVSFSVTDVDGNPSVVPAGTVVTVVGLPEVQIDPVVLVAAAAAGTTGQPITVSPIVVITDLDSDIESATVTISDPAEGDVLAWGTVPNGFEVTTGAGSVTFTGVATAAVYQQLLQSVTLTSTAPGLKSVSFSVTDVDGNPSVLPAATVVTVIGLPAASPIVLTSVVSVAHTAGGAATPVDSGILVLDGDSSTMSGATVTISNPADGDSLTWGTVPDGVSAGYNSGVLTFDGEATASQYQQLLRTVAFSTSSTALASIRSISFTISDSELNTSAPGTVAVAVVSLPVLSTPVVVTSVANVNYTSGATETVVDPNLTLLDSDSSAISRAVVSIVGGAASGEVLAFTPQAGIDGTYSAGVLTFEGTAPLSVYQQLLRSVTFSSDSALATIKSVSFVVTDSDGNVSGPGLVAVTVVSAPVNVAPLVITSGINLSYTAGSTAVNVDSNLGLLDLDSGMLKGATVKITGNFSTGDLLSFAAQQGISGVFDANTGTLTFTGDALVADYQQLLRSVKIATASTAPATIKTVSFTVTDIQNASSLPGAVAVAVLAAPVNLAPLVTTVLGPIYTAGNTAVAVNPLLTILDLDSSTMQGASVAITDNFTSGDVLDFTAVAGIDGNYDSVTGVLTFTGEASTAAYQDLLRSVTFASGASGSTAVKTITITVTDAQGAPSPNATALVTQTSNSAPILTAPLGGGLLLLGAQVVSPGVVIVDDSSYLNQAVITITNVQSVDKLEFTPVGDITGTYENGVLTLSGEGTVAQYQAAMASVRFSKTGINLLGSRTITMVVRDFQGVYSNTTTGLLTLIL